MLLIAAGPIARMGDSDVSARTRCSVALPPHPPSSAGVQNHVIAIYVVGSIIGNSALASTG